MEVTRRAASCFTILLAVAVCALLNARAQEPNSPPPTFSKDVAPILQKHCQTCHRPGEAAPFSMLTYRDTKPWASTIKMVVTQKIMPPWYADPQYGHFSNERSLSPAEIRKLVTWVNGGAQEGDPKDMPPPVKEFVEGWGIPQPDMVFQLPKPFSVPAAGVIEYQYVIVPTGFKEDKWVQMLEVRPTDRSVVHHIIAYLREPGSNYFKDQKPGAFFIAPPAKTDEKTDTSALPSDFLVGYVPGQPAEILHPGEGKLIKAGSDIVFEVHYTPNGKATTDQTKLGLVFAKTSPKERVLTLSASNGTFKIPPCDPNYRVDASFNVRKDVTLVALHPHMHARGKSFEYRIIFPDGKSKTILNVPVYNWHWQLWYNLAEPMDLPQGAKIECTAHFDNSPDNPENPDPTKAVIWGQQSWDEMMVGFFNLKFDANMSPKELTAQEGAIHTH
ncbi:MAG: thiol-disulfide isomerase [Acidobacteria bacterium]|nr:MAG: thiol-disulfide isomerase [Acidobacteriota bacterium]